ncbi:MAG: GntR family transcriptional regulator [bacterium]|nr:GntR family transcriptional regulator [bacterium]
MLPFTVKLETGSPVSKQVIFAVKKAIASGRLAPGDKFPSVRVLSKELRINPNTAQKIISRLVQEKLLEIYPGIGSVVASKNKVTKHQSKMLLKKKVEQLVVEAIHLSLSKTELIDAIDSLWEKIGEEK